MALGLAAGCVVLALGLASAAAWERAHRPAVLSPESYSQTAGREFREGHITQAVVDYNRAIALAPRDAAPYIGLAVLYEGVQRPDLAIDGLEQLEAANPNAPHLWCRLAEAHLGVNDIKQALALGREAVRREPDCARAQSAYGIALARSRYWDSAVQALQKARVLAPEDRQVGEVLVDVLLQKGAYLEGVRVSEELLAYEPRSALLHYRAGWGYSRLPQHGDAPRLAIRHLERAATLSPKWFEPLAELGRIYRSEGKTDLAIAAFERAYRVNPGVPGVVYNLAGLYHRVNDPRAAGMDRQFRQLLKNTEHLTAMRRDYNTDSGGDDNTLALAEVEARSGSAPDALHRLRILLLKEPANAAALRLYLRIDAASRAKFPAYLAPGPAVGAAEME